jgi:release factor glutamine methyltransferase
MPEIYEPAEDSYLISKTLKETTPNLLKQNPDINFLEIGSGSGILLETAKGLGIKKSHIFSSDINPDAVEHCKKLGFNCIYSDLFGSFKGRLSEGNRRCPRFDLIVFNPPYLPENRKEPKSSKLATTGGKLGSEIINKFLKQAKKHLNSGGKIYLLTSSLTKDIDWGNYHKKLLGKEKIFMEELFVWELTY